MDYKELSNDNKFHKWLVYLPQEAQIARYGRNQLFIITSAWKIIDVYNAFVNAKQSFRSAGYEDYGDLCGDDETSRNYTKCHFLMSAIMEYNTCLDLCYQVIWAYIYPNPLEYFREESYKALLKKCDSACVHKRLNELIDGDKTEYSDLKKLLSKLQNEENVMKLNQLCNYLKHRGIIRFQEYEDKMENMLLAVDSKAVDLFKENWCSANVVEEILSGFHNTFQEYFEEIIKFIIPEDYLNTAFILEEYEDVVKCIRNRVNESNPR